MNANGAVLQSNADMNCAMCLINTVNDLHDNNALAFSL